MLIAMNIRRLIPALAACLALLPLSGASAQDGSFPAFIQWLSAKARSEGVSEGTIARMTEGLTPNERVISLDRAQPGTPTATGFPSMRGYLDDHNSAQRIAAGRRAYQAAGATRSDIERRYGIPSAVLFAIWGHETNYGSFKGSFDLSRSLATLAWEGRRRDLFSQEWVDLLKIADLGVRRETLVGSWAGAFGHPQFLPSIYLRLAVDGDGDGHRDIWNNHTDTLHSIANYFRDAGWRPGQPWGVRASIPDGFNWNAVQSKTASPVCPRVHERHSQWKTVAEWKLLGVTPRAAIFDDVMATLLQPDGPGTPAYLLTQNYRVILEYNCSNYYAMSVGLLADEIAR